MFCSSGTSSTNVVTFWLKLAFMRFCLFSCLTASCFLNFNIQQHGFAFFLAFIHFKFLSIVALHSTTFHVNSLVCILGLAGRFMLRPAVVGHRNFQLIFTDQSIQFAELRTIIFAFLYIPPLDYWPFEPPVHGPLNLDLYHFSIACISVYRPCVTFRTVDTPSLAQSPASATS